MVWTKKGLIFECQNDNYWNKSHAQVPTAFLVSDCVLRIFYATRDSANRSFISFFDVNPRNPLETLYIHNKPVLKPGCLGAFDDSGVMPSSIVRNKDGSIYLYYTGWNVRTTVPYQNSIGLAVSFDGGMNFERVSVGPVLAQNNIDPFFIGTATVIQNTKFWMCWYASCTGWFDLNGTLEPRYHLKYAQSLDGISWVREGLTSIDYKSTDEGGIVRASVLANLDSFEMWYSYRKIDGYRDNRSRSYRIGYANSNDGISWKRYDHLAGIDVAPQGWDSQMIAYPNVIHNENSTYMFYNGNGFGQSGIGFAIRENLIEKARNFGN